MASRGTVPDHGRGITYAYSSTAERSQAFGG